MDVKRPPIASPGVPGQHVHGPTSIPRADAPHTDAPPPLAEGDVSGAARKLAQQSAHRQVGFQGGKPSSLVAMRLVAGAASPARSDVGTAVLTVQLTDPRTGAPPRADQVAESMLVLLKRGLPAASPEVMQQIAGAPTEGYYVVTYDERSGALSLKQVAAGDEHTVTVRADDVAKAVQPGETLLGGLHNHPGKRRARPSQEDAQASALLEARFRGYMDFVVAGGTGNVSAARVQTRGAAAVGDGGDLTFHAWKPNQMNRDPDKPSTVERVDRPHTDVPGAQNHIHFKRMRGTRDEDGGWGHGGGSDSLLTSDERKWIQKWDRA